MFRHARIGSAAAGLFLAMGIARPVMADPADVFPENFVSGVVTAVPSGSPVFGARVEAVGVTDFEGPVVDETAADGSYALFLVPAGEQVVRVSGDCLDTTDASVTVTPIDADVLSTFGVDLDISVVNRSVAGTGDCLPYPHEPDRFFPGFWDRLVLNHRATLANNRPFSISLPFAVKFGGTSYRRVWASANGWIGFNKPTASCDRLTPTSAPAGSIFALAQCGETTEVQYDVRGQKPSRVMILRWKNLVTADTSEPSDVAIRFFEDHPTDIGVSYIHLGGPKDGSNAFIGFSTKSGNVFTLGNHEAAVQNESSLIFRPGL